MAKLRIQRHLSTQLIFDASTMASALPLDWELVVLAVDGIRWFLLPLILVARPGLELMSVVSVDLFGVDFVSILLAFLGRHDGQGLFGP